MTLSFTVPGKPKRRQTPKTPADCKTCGASFMAYSKMHLYCEPCSAARDRQRKQSWYARNGKENDPQANKRHYQAFKNRAIENGKALSADNRFSISDQPRPHLCWLQVVKFPFSYSLSKNAIYRVGQGGHVFLRKESNAQRAAITLLIRNALSRSGTRIANNKLWLGILVEKPNARGDAINVVDLVCDAVKDAVGLDDRWFSLIGLDWRIVKDNPQIYITIGQETGEDASICSYCGRMLPFASFTKNRSSKLGISRVCRDCSRMEDAQKRECRRAAISTPPQP